MSGAAEAWPQKVRTASQVCSMEATNLKSKQNRKFFDTQEMNKEKAVEHRPKKQLPD